MEDLAHATFLRMERRPVPSLDYERTMLHGPPAWFGEEFICCGRVLFFSVGPHDAATDIIRKSVPRL